MTQPKRPKLRSLVVFVLMVVFAAVLGVFILVSGVQHLVRAPHCGGQPMSSIDGCEILDPGGRGSSEIQLYWPGGLMAGIARNIPADRHLHSRDQMRSSDREDGVALLLAGSALLVLAVALIRSLVRGLRNTRPNVRRGFP